MARFEDPPEVSPPSADNNDDDFAELEFCPSCIRLNEQQLVRGSHSLHPTDVMIDFRFCRLVTTAGQYIY